MKLSDKLIELKILLPEAPQAVASYVPAKRHGSLVYVSGQLPFLKGDLMATGPISDLEGAPLSIVDGQELAKRCFLNALSAATSVVDIDQIIGVLRIGGWVTSSHLFSKQAQVINGASLMAEAIFDEAGQHVRAAVGAIVLPLNSPVEVEVQFIIKD